MIASSRSSIDLRPIFKSYWHAIDSGESDDFFQPAAMTSTCDQKRLHRPAGSECLPHSVNPG
jgi:hypothetical protein